MGLFKSSERGKGESGLSLLQGLAILAALGIIVKLVVDYFMG